jgi:hypothetical protein
MIAGPCPEAQRHLTGVLRCARWEQRTQPGHLLIERPQIRGGHPGLGLAIPHRQVEEHLIALAPAVPLLLTLHLAV